MHDISQIDIIFISNLISNLSVKKAEKQPP